MSACYRYFPNVFIKPLVFWFKLQNIAMNATYLNIAYSKWIMQKFLHLPIPELNILSWIFSSKVSKVSRVSLASAGSWLPQMAPRHQLVTYLTGPTEFWAPRTPKSASRRKAIERPSGNSIHMGSGDECGFWSQRNQGAPPSFTNYWLCDTEPTTEPHGAPTSSCQNED